MQLYAQSRSIDPPQASPRGLPSCVARKCQHGTCSLIHLDTGDLHLGLLHAINQLQLALSDLDDLLNQTSSDLVLKLIDSARHS